jgi:hypothetical protein
MEAAATGQDTRLRRAIGPKLLTVFIIGDVLGAASTRSWARLGPK